MASMMIQEKRLEGSIDQIDGLIIFKKLGLTTWDETIGSLCRELDLVVDRISASHPGFVERYGKEL